jgi:hypothetical protein
VLSSLGDPSNENERDKQIKTYHCNNFGYDRLWLAVPCIRNDMGTGKPMIMCHRYAQVRVWV